MTSVSSGGSTAGYGYEDYRLSTITHNGFSYTFGYDGYGNNTSVAVGGRTLTTNTFNLQAGLPAGSTYGNGDTVTYSYDNKERLVGKSFNGTPAVSYKYDAMGSLVETEDLLNNISFKTQYDLINRVTGVTSSDGGEYRISYDDQNRIDATLEKIAGVTLKNEYQYSDTSIIEGIKLNGSQILTYDWDDLTRMTSQTLKLTAPFTTQYTYLKGSNAGGETTLVAEIKNGGETLSYTYDQFGNIVSVSQNGTVVESYEYDGLNQLIKVTNGANVTEYAYDAGGNLTSVKLNGEVQDTYGYTDAGWKDLLTSFNGQAITYDEIGNPLTYRDGYQFTWQNGRRLASISHGNDSISYTYDPDGIRTSKTVNGTTTKYHVMNGTLLGQTKGSDTIVFLYDEKGNKYGFDYNGTKYYYIFNVQGDVIGILNQAGQKIVSYTYDPWGKVLSVDGSEASTIGQINPIRYRGYYYDTETGFYYLQSRYYDPTTRRFLNVDSQLAGTAQVQGYNLFAYCLNNPVNFSDPTGHWPDWGTLLGGVVTVLVGVAAVAAVVGTGGAATPLVALGLASIGAAGLGTIGFGCSEIVESFTGQNPIRNAIGSSAYDTAKTASTLISAGGASWIASSPYLGNSSSSAPKAGFVSSASPNSSVQGKPTFVAPPKFPGYDPTKAPKGFEWRGSDAPITGKGNYVNVQTGEWLHPDLNHGPPIGPHWDYNYRGSGVSGFRIFPDDTIVSKK
ncbi:MAG: RHS repeat-associated core domain-containing protein [[Clostridium] leptum]